ncbi:GNAT family N-acetyltransferase [Spirosoma flavum]|uniref:GNAT family N-acetyltransferase n=1 Tax=Spirosoma flavum TaxID=2048557 RepID=A0ABW6AT30_9BACT
MAEHTILLQYSPQSAYIPKFCQSGFLFNDHQHLQQQDSGNFYLLSALNQTTQQAEARCAFYICSDEAISPVAAPFGSIEFAESLPDAVLDRFLVSLLEAVRGVGARKLRLVNYPHCYAPQQAEKLTAILAKHDFYRLEANQNSFLPIGNKRFEAHLISAERRRLRKCREANFQFVHWQTPNLTEAINFIQQTRQQQGYQMTISTERLIDLWQKFPNQFSVFVVKDGTQLAALSITVRVRDDILYNFIPASHPSYHAFSPMVMLIDGLFTYCQQQEIRLLDLGVSLDANRQPKPSLMRFKRNLGALESPKLTFEKVV